MTKNAPIASGNTAVALASPDPATSRVYGVVDLLRDNRIAGWAIDRADAAAAVTVDIHRNGRLISSVVADRHRPDLEKGGIGNGKYGFRAEIDPPIDPGFEFTISATARAADGTATILKPIGPAARETSTETLLLHGVHCAVQTVLLRLSDLAKTEAELSRLVERLDVTQARIECSIAAASVQNPEESESGFGKIVYGTMAVALLSLSIGLVSLFHY